MEYTTIYTGDDQAEISIIKHLFEENNIPYNVLGEATASSAGIGATGNMGMRIQVPVDQVDRAKNILRDNGFLGEMKKGREKRRKEPRFSKWMFIFLAALVLIIVSFLIMWFMSPS
ncbi:MAG: DUF2007 domain-containing protein [Gillisia sp.]